MRGCRHVHDLTPIGYDPAVTLPPLACTVRGCGLPLARRERALACPAGHAFDLARSGHINLLQPQDRRSLDAGDSREVVEARARLVSAGVGQALVEAVVARAATLDLGERPVAIDLGSGSGDTLGALATARRVNGVGIDLSAAAAEHAARRFPDLTWVVANADRRVPLVDRSVQLALSLHARRNPAECARVLAPDGYLLVAVPAADDLIELREQVLGGRVERDRTPALLEEHRSLFDVVDQFEVRETSRLDGDRLRALLRVTYRGARANSAGRVTALEPTEVTLASVVVLFRVTESRSRPAKQKHPAPDGRP